MKNLVYKLGTQMAVTLVTLLLVFAPFASLTAQAQNDPAFTSGAAPITGTNAPVGGGSQTSVTNLNSAGTVAPTSNANNPANTTNTFNSSTNYPSNTNTDTSSLNAANGNITNTLPTTAPTAQQQQTSTDILANCTKTPTISGCVASLLYVFTVGIGSAFAYIAAYFFDITIQLSLNGASYGLDFVSTSWTTARDLANMAFLFILLYIAFTIILRADTGNTMSLLAGVIIVALLVNFSFFFTRLIIDAGNILTIQFYNAIPAPPISQTIQGTPVSGTVASTVNTVAGYAFSGDPSKTQDLTASIMNMIQVQNLLNNQSFSAANGSGTFNLISTIFIFI